ncbi:MAG TPA: hypothetical protein VNA89_10805 [Gemmatimonadaceae bacterium]|nr:hypothetical protein [Gemmatimonadaceae bacterium]
MSNAKRWGASIAAALVLAARGAAAQGPGAPCDLRFPNTPETRLTLVEIAAGQRNTYFGGGVAAECIGQNLTLRSDSAEYYADRGVLYLIGNVQYREPRASVDATRMTYYRSEERVFAEGNVVASMPNGSTMRGPNADYYRQTPRRPRARLVATGRPHLVVIDPDTSPRADRRPADIDADRIVMEGDSLVFAGGRVVLARPDLLARGDSAVVDGGQEWARLMRSPTIEGRGDRPFTMRGQVIDVYSQGRQLRRVLSKASARVDSRDLALTADTIDLRLEQQQLERAYAWGQGRARATSPQQDIEADSIDAYLPQQRLREVRALRNAYAHGLPDTLKVRTTGRDWLRGDTIIARFDSLSPPTTGDTSRRPVIRELVAIGSARSFYHIPTDGRPGAPAINYVRGRQIAVSFANQQVQQVRVTDQASGVYAEPAADTSARAAPPARATRPPTARPGVRP